jgi:hypothetical protein
MSLVYAFLSNLTNSDSLELQNVALKLCYEALTIYKATIEIDDLRIANTYKTLGHIYILG